MNNYPIGIAVGMATAQNSGCQPISDTAVIVMLVILVVLIGLAIWLANRN